MVALGQRERRPAVELGVVEHVQAAGVDLERRDPSGAASTLKCLEATNHTFRRLRERIMQRPVYHTVRMILNHLVG